MQKNRSQKQKEYNDKYGHIPLDLESRLEYMCDLYKLSQKKMEQILNSRINSIHNLFYTDLDIVVLFEEPEGAKRPRHTVTKSNFHNLAKTSDFIRVYSPGAKDDSNYMKLLIGEELSGLDRFVYTPCNVEYIAYLPTPKSYSITKTFMAEIGLDRPISKPDWDNIGKKYSDMYNAGVWIDDSYVIDGVVKKYYSILPRVEIKLKFLNCAYNKHQYDSVANKIGERELRYLNDKGELV